MLATVFAKLYNKTMYTHPLDGRKKTMSKKREYDEEQGAERSNPYD